MPGHVNAGCQKDASVPPLKTIAVKPIARGGRKPAALAIDLESELPDPGPAVARPARRTVAAPEHRYRIGERLRMAGGGYSAARQAAACKVVARLPYEGSGALLYRVRSDTEQFE